MQPPLENPYLAADAEVAKLRLETPVIFMDFHAEATSEKIGMGRMLDGKISGMIGTHTHVQTADETIFPNGTAFLCDAGMCGPVESIIGSRIEPIVSRFRTSLRGKHIVAPGPVKVCGAWIEIDCDTGKALHIERVAEIWTGE
jgi:calcineurin-like phosphoesterase